MRAAVRAQLETRKNSQREWIGARCQPFRAIEYLARREEKTDVTPGRAAGRLSCRWERRRRVKGPEQRCTGGHPTARSATPGGVRLLKNDCSAKGRWGGRGAGKLSRANGQRSRLPALCARNTNEHIWRAKTATPRWAVRATTSIRPCDRQNRDDNASHARDLTTTAVAVFDAKPICTASPTCTATTCRLRARGRAQ